MAAKANIDSIFISGMMAGYSEQILRRAAQALQVTCQSAQDGAAHPGTFVERWQIPI